MLRIGINGFGRIGKTLLRVIVSDAQARKKIQVTAINIGPNDIEQTAYTFAHDTLMGPFGKTVSMQGNRLIVDTMPIHVMATINPDQIRWDDQAVDWVVEASGQFTLREQAKHHIDKAGAHHVLITAPSDNADITIIPGVNHQLFDHTQHRIVSLGSCTTNAVAPLLKILDTNFSITNSFMTTIHAYTNTQVLLDVPIDDPRRSRAAALNIIPSTTGVSKTIDLVMPGMGARFNGVSLRVPVAKVSLIDLVFATEKSIDQHILANTLIEASQEEPFKGIVAHTTEPVVSSDFAGSSYSVIVDGLLTSCQSGHMGKIFGWYDNEWAYCERLKDFLLMNCA